MVQRILIGTIGTEILAHKGETLNVIEIFKYKLKILSTCLETRMLNLSAEYLDQFMTKFDSVAKATETARQNKSLNGKQKCKSCINVT